MSMFTSEFMAKLHEMEPAKANEKVRSVAVAMDVDPDEAEHEYTLERAKATLPQLMERTAGVVAPAGSSLALCLELGCVASVELVEGEAVLKLAAPSAAMTVVKKKLGEKRRYQYFSKNGHVKNAKQWLVEHRPGSPATVKLLEMDAANRLFENTGGKQGSLSKMGAWDAVAKYDPELIRSGEFSRTEIG